MPVTFTSGLRACLSCGRHFINRIWRAFALSAIHCSCCSVISVGLTRSTSPLRFSGLDHAAASSDAVPHGLQNIFWAARARMSTYASRFSRWHYPRCRCGRYRQQRACPLHAYTLRSYARWATYAHARDDDILAYFGCSLPRCGTRAACRACRELVG